jgi:PTS system mannose-specific IIC component
MIATGTLALLTVLGAVVGLDFVSFPQAMLSRPIAAATLSGAICGNAAVGLLVGVVLECFALETMPFGASRYPEWGPASVTAAAAAVLSVDGPDGVVRVLPFAVLAGLAVSMIGGLTLVWLRRLNLVVAAHYRDELASGDAAAVLAVHWTGMVIDFGRAGAVTALGILVVMPARTIVLAAMPHGAGGEGLAVAGVIAVGVAGGAVWKVVHTTKGYAWWLFAGTAIGCAVALFV